MIEDPIPYKLYAMRDVSLRPITSLSPLFRLDYFTDRLRFHNDTVSKIRKQMPCIIRKSERAIQGGINDWRSCFGINSRSHSRADKTPFEKRRKALSGYIIPSAVALPAKRLVTSG
jgi:hypothetical protein